MDGKPEGGDAVRRWMEVEVLADPDRQGQDKEDQEVVFLILRRQGGDQHQGPQEEEGEPLQLELHPQQEEKPDKHPGQEPPEAEAGLTGMGLAGGPGSVHFRVPV